MSGNPLDTKSFTATIRQHSGNAYRQLTLDLSTASLASDTNPFISSSSTPSSSTSSSSPKSSDDGDNNDDDSQGEGEGSGATVTGSGDDKLETYQKAHGIVMGLTVVLLFPLGAVFMRLGGGIWGHAALQSVSLIALIVGFGLGVKLAKIDDSVSYICLSPTYFTSICGHKC